jgi:hypothetical protein
MSKTRKFGDTDIVLRENAPEIPAEPVSAPESHTVSGYLIETKPIPKRSAKNSLNYPIGKLMAGSTESFLVPATPDKVKAVTASIRTFAYRNNYAVTLRTEETGVRVWRAVLKPQTA